MILLILKISFLTIIWTLLWKIATAEDMVLENIGKWGERKVKEGHKIFEGLITCQWCLPNIHGILIVWPLAFGIGIMPFEWDYKYVLIYPFCLGLSSFITGMLWDLYLTMNAIRENYTLQNKYLNNEEQAHSD